MLPGDKTIPPPSQSLSSAGITPSNPDVTLLAKSKLFQYNNIQSVSNFRPSPNSQAAIHAQIPAIYQPTVTHDIAGQLPSFQDWVRDKGNSHNHVEAFSGHHNAGQPPSVGTIEHGHRNSKTILFGGDNGGDLPPSQNDVGPREGSQSGTSAGDQNVGEEATEYCQISLTGKNIYKYKPPPYYLNDKYS